MNLLEMYKKISNSDEINIAYYVINYCNERNYNITNLKLIKLLYFINIEFMLRNNGQPIFNEEFLAWRHGPVLQSVYDYFCMGIVLPNNKKLNEIMISITDDKKNVIDYVLSKRGNMSAWDLVQETHILNGPWDKVYKKFKDEDGICKAKISNKDIYNFYKEYYG